MQNIHPCQEVPVDQRDVTRPPPVLDNVTKGGEVGESSEEKDHGEDDSVNDVREPPVILQYDSMTRRDERDGVTSSH